MASGRPGRPCIQDRGVLVRQPTEKGWDFQVVIGLSRLRFRLLRGLDGTARLLAVLGRIAHVGLRLGPLAAAEQAPTAATMIAVIVILFDLRLRRRPLTVQIALGRAARGGRAGFIFLDPRIDDGIQGARLRFGDADHRLGARFRFASGRGLKGRHDRRRLDTRFGRAGRLGADRLAGLGPRLLPLLVMATTTMGLAGMIAGALIGLLRPRRAPQPVEPAARGRLCIDLKHEREFTQPSKCSTNWYTSFCSSSMVRSLRPARTP